MTQEHKYQAVIDPQNRNNSHSLALGMIQDVNSSRLDVLEVGCSTGYFGSYLRSLGHRVTGVEMESRSCAEAARVLDEVHCCTIQEFFACHPDRLFDVITFGDVIEHLADPEPVLRSAAQHLKRGGQLICSVPNVTHASIRAMLLDGNWSYSDLGILDRTHLRFFDKQGLLGTFEAAGLSVDHLQAVRLSVDDAARMCGLQITDRARNLVESYVRDDRTANVFQYVLAASPQPGKALRASGSDQLMPPKPLRILVLSDGPEDSITKIRLGIPLVRFADEGCRELRIQAFRAARFSDIKWADVVVMQRGVKGWVKGLMLKCKSLGKPVIYEIDDLLTDLPDFLGHHKLYFKNRLRIMELIRSADMVTVTQPRLAQALSEMNPVIRICPNYGNPDVPIRPPRELVVDGGVVSLIIASSDRIRMDFVIPALGEIVARFGKRVRVVCIGPISEKLNAAGIPCESYSIVPHHEFMELVRQQVNPIGIIPLDDSRFSSCKSAVKYFDYSIGGVPSVCSNVPPYADVVSHMSNGLLAENSTESWVACLSALIENDDLRLAIAEAAQQHVVNNHSISQTVDAWRAVFSEIAPGDVVGAKAGGVLSPAAVVSLLVHQLSELNRRRKLRRSQKRRNGSRDADMVRQEAR